MFPAGLSKDEWGESNGFQTKEHRRKLVSEWQGNLYAGDTGKDKQTREFIYDAWES